MIACETMHYGIILFQSLIMIAFVYRHYKIRRKHHISLIHVHGNLMSNILIIIIITHGRFAIAFLPLTTCLSTELFEEVFIEKSSG